MLIRGALPAVVGLLLVAGCASRGPDISIVRTAYQIPLRGSAVAAETHTCLRRCRSPGVSTESAYFRCIARCPYVRVHPGRCSPRDQPPDLLCIEQIEGAGTGPAVSLQDLVIQAAGPQNLE